MEFKAVYSTFLYVESFELSTTKIRLDLRWERKHIAFHLRLLKHLIEDIVTNTLACLCVSVCTQADETVLQFTNRIKADIARQGGLVDLHWSVTLSLSVCL